MKDGTAAVPATVRKTYVALKVGEVTVPEKEGLLLNTTSPVPVLAVTPVPPCDTPKTPEEMASKLRSVKPLPLPLKFVAVIVSATMSVA